MVTQTDELAVADRTSSRKRSTVAKPVQEVEFLRAKEVLQSPPAWVQEGDRDGVSVTRPEGATSDLYTISSERWATLGEAEVQITQKVLDLVRQRCTFPRRDTWGMAMVTPPQNVLQGPPVWAMIRDDAVQQVVGEYIDKDFGHGVRGMYRVHAQVTIPEHLREALSKVVLQQEQTGRVAMVMGALLIITVVLVLGAVFLRVLRRRKPASELKIPFFSRAEES